MPVQRVDTFFSHVATLEAYYLLGHCLTLQEHATDAGSSAQQQYSRGGRKKHRSHLDGGRNKAAGRTARGFAVALHLLSREKRCSFPSPGYLYVLLRDVARASRRELVVVLGKVAATTSSRTDRFTSALSIGGLSLCLAALKPSLILDSLSMFSSWFRNGCCKLNNEQREVSPHFHPRVEHVKTGRSGKRWIALGNRWKGRRDRDNQSLPVACQTLGRRREKTDRIGEIGP
jgi:hypothetical protein